MVKEVTILDEIRWAKENMGNKKRGPTAFATKMRDSMRDSEDYFNKFSLQFLQKLLPKDAGEEKEEGARLDDAGAVAVIDKILRVSRRVKGLEVPE